MIAKLSLLSRRLIIEAEAADVKTLFRELGSAADVFEADDHCQACGSEPIRPHCRTVDGLEYYSLKCTECQAELSFGQRKDGGLFAKRKDDLGHNLEDGGWKRWQHRAIEAGTPAATRKA
jgi:hypothetical protein